MNLAVPEDYRLKIKENEKGEKYLDFAKELRKLWNMSVTVILTVVGTLSTVLNSLRRGLEVLEILGKIETIQTTALSRSARILRKVLETCRDLLSLRLLSKNISKRWREKHTRNNNNNNNNNNLQKKKRTYRILDFVVTADRRVKLKESTKRNKYQDLAREQKKLWNLKVTLIPIVICALVTVTKDWSWDKRIWK